MKKNEILENISIDKLIFGGKSLAIAPDGRKIIVTGGAVPGSVVNLRILKARTHYFEAQIIDTVKKSPLEQELPAHYQVYGGCKWLPIAYPEQLRIKEEQVREAFHYIEKYWDSSKGKETNESLETELSDESVPQIEIPILIKREPPIFHPIVPSPEIYGYRNKVEFSWGKYISEKEGVHDTFRFGFHAQAQFDRIIDCDFCVLADDEINAIFREMNEYSRKSGLPTYDPKTNIGFWRHFVVRKAHFTGEIMLILSVNHEFEEYSRKYEGDILVFAGKLMNQFPAIASIYLLQNSGKADIVTGEAILMKGKPTITENLLGKSFEINPKSFFQTNSLGAEKLYTVVRDLMKTSGGTLLDLYAGTGTIGILLADRFEHIYSVELVTEASKDGAKNALKNGVSNITFINEKTEKFLPRFLEENNTITNKTQETSQKGSHGLDKSFIRSGDMGDSGENRVSERGVLKSTMSDDTEIGTRSSHFSEVSLIIDPPRDGMHPAALPDILKFNAKEIIYVSCNPATLARDLDYILAHSNYRLTDIVPVDMFPHTHHIETVVRLEK